MAINQTQLQYGLSLTEFIDQYATEEQCEQVLYTMRWPGGYECPQCHGNKYCIVHHGSKKTYQCNRCHLQTTLTSGTIFHHSHLPLSIWFQGIYFISQAKNNVSALELHRELGISYRSAWRLKQKLLQVMYEQEQNRVLRGRIEVDDAYLGGAQSGGKVGRGSENKVPILVAVETDAGNYPRLGVFSSVEAFSTEVVESWAEQHIAKGSTVVTDGLGCFNAVARAGCLHEIHTVGKTQHSTEVPYFGWVNTILGNIKTSLAGTYHSFKYAKYRHRYLGGVQYLFNHRFNMKAIFTYILHSCVKIGSRTEQWLRKGVIDTT